MRVSYATISNDIRLLLAFQLRRSAVEPIEIELLLVKKDLNLEILIPRRR